jgi:hypothetical protein
MTKQHVQCYPGKELSKKQVRSEKAGPSQKQSHATSFATLTNKNEINENLLLTASFFTV